MRNRTLALAWAVMSAAVSCAGSLSVQKHLSVFPITHRFVFVVENRFSREIPFNPLFSPETFARRAVEPIGNTSLHIRRAFEAHGYSVTSGRQEEIPRIVDLIVFYSDTWKWDFKMFLRELTVRVLDGRTKVVLAVGKYTSAPGDIHDYPTSEREAPRLVDAILGEPPQQHPE